MSCRIISIHDIVKYKMHDKAILAMLETEMHHGHEIIVYDNKPDVLFWKPDAAVQKACKKINLNDLIDLLGALGQNRNSEFIRDMYRKKGTSLFGYWETFYCETNNPIAHEYKPPVK